MTTATQVYSTQELIETIENQAKDRMVTKDRVVAKFPVGKIVRQGDIYIHAVPVDHAHGAFREDKQLAQGVSQGSHHIAHCDKVYEGTTLPKGIANGTFLGPMIMSDVEIRIGHPQHADVIIPPGCYQITHQMDARTLQRVTD